MAWGDGVIDRVADSWKRVIGGTGQSGVSQLSTGLSNQPSFVSYLGKGFGGAPAVSALSGSNRIGGSSSAVQALNRRNRGFNPFGGVSWLNNSFNDPFQGTQARESWYAKMNGLPDPNAISAPGMEPLPGGGDPSGSRGLEGVQNWMPMIQQAAGDAEIPWQVIASIMGIESGGDQGSYSVAGAVGLMQIMPNFWQDTANQYGGDLWDPYTNIRTGAEILKTLYNQYGSWDKAAAAYLGAIDANGNITSAQDGYGTDGFTYVSLFQNNLAALGYGSPTEAEQWSGGEVANEQAAHAINFAEQVIGTPYVWGGADRNGFDCSGLTLWAYAQAGIELPRTAQEQYNATARIDPNMAQPGDLVFFGSEGGITHVAIYLGNGQILDAPSEGKSVRIISLDTPWYAGSFAGFGRVY